MYHVGPARRGRLRRAVPAGLGRRRAQLATPTSARPGPGSGYTLWGGYDRPSPDYANAKVILLLSVHLETGHYFNPHAQRIMEAKATARQARRDRPADVEHRLARGPLDRPVARQRGRDPAGRRVAPAAHATDRRATTSGAGSTGTTYLDELHPERRARLRDVPRRADRRLRAVHLRVRRGRGPGAGRADRASSPRSSPSAGTALSAHVWRSAAAGNLGGWQVSRCLFFLNVLTGSVGTPGGTSPNGWNKFIAHGFDVPEGHDRWNELLWPRRVPAVHQRDVDPAAALPERRPRPARRLLLPRLQPDLDQPRRLQLDGGAHRRDKVGLHVALTPTWSETAAFADYVLPMGHATERHDTHSYETHAGRWLGFRQPVRRVAIEKLGRAVRRHPRHQPGRGVGGERVLVRAVVADRPRRLARHPEVLRVAVPAGREGHRRRVLPLDLREPGARAAGEGGRPRDSRRWHYMRKYGVVEIATDVYRQDERPLTDAELDGAVAGRATACCASRPTDESTPPLVGEAGSVGVGSRTGRASPAG